MGRTAYTEPQCLYTGDLYLTFYLYYEPIRVKEKLDQHMPRWKPLCISRYCMVSVLVNHLHAYPDIWQTLLPHTSYTTFWSTGLACEVTRPHTPHLFLVWVHKEHGLLAKNCTQQKKLSSNSCSPLTVQGQKIKLAEQQILFWDMQNCAYRSMKSFQTLTRVI